jgi:hemerythrin
MTIVWREQMSVGIKAIDSDHRKLIAIINEFEDVIRAKIDEPRLNEIAKRLYEYARFHFQREERIQAHSNYSDLEDHKRQHELLLKQLQGFIRKVFIDRSVTVDASTADELSGFLKGWLVNHVIQVDLRMKGHLMVPVELA